MTSLMTTPTGGEAPPRAKSPRKPSPAAKRSKTARTRAATEEGNGKPSRRRFDDSAAPTFAAFEFSVENGEGRYGRDEWHSEVRIVSAEAWEAEKIESRSTWASKSLDDGRIMLCRLIPPKPAAVYHDHYHEPATATAIKSFRARLLDWLESQPDVGNEPQVILEGEGACTITFGVPNSEGGFEAVDVTVRHNRHLGSW